MPKKGKTFGKGLELEIKFFAQLRSNKKNKNLQLNKIIKEVNYREKNISIARFYLEFPKNKKSIRKQNSKLKNLDFKIIFVENNSITDEQKESAEKFFRLLEFKEQGVKINLYYVDSLSQSGKILLITTMISIPVFLIERILNSLAEVLRSKDE